ncbi:MAG: proline dehydrogenase family protein [Niabella sp.]
MTIENMIPEISFLDTELAFQYKTTKELHNAHLLFSMMAKPWLVKMGTKVTPWAVRNKLPINGLIKSTIFKQFAGGETLPETKPVVEKLGKYKVQVILDYGVEGSDGSEEDYNHAEQEFIKVIDYSATQPNIPFMSIKVTGLARFALLEKLEVLMKAQQGSLINRYNAALEQLDGPDREAWQRLEERLERICHHAVDVNMGVLIDAEETWIQDPLDALVTLMMVSFNKEKATVYNTAQLYRHDRLQFVKDCHEAAVSRGFILGIKLVRGAYMEKERARAAEKGYPSPIQPNKESTDRDFDATVDFCMENLDKVSVLVCTHNENSNLNVVKHLQSKGLPFGHPHVFLSQLYGMSDNITFNLAHAGCNVSKYLPFGPVADVIPYLMRRAEENTSVKGQTSRELSLITKELKRRKNN